MTVSPKPSDAKSEGFSSGETVIDFCPIPSEARSDLDGVLDVDDTPEPKHRFDVVPVKLETRGVTEQKVWKQGTLFLRESIWKESIVAKLDEAHRNDIADHIRSCHTERNVRQCTGCKKHSVFFNRCEVKWCPICASRLAKERRESVGWWTKQIHQPKHVVLTARNADVITSGMVQRFKKAFARLRRTKFASNWKGGFYSLEVTNEGRGWHLHLHALVDARWIDNGELARTWAKCIGQEFAIVKVKDARDHNYLNEVTKYAVKGNDLSSWQTTDIVAFVEAFENIRTFGVFGSLYAKRTEWKEFLDELRAGRVRCECGCDNWRILSDVEFEWEETVREAEAPRPPPATHTIHKDQIVFATILRQQFPH